MPAAQSTARDIFLAAIEQPTSEARAAFVVAACQHDANLEREVAALLAAHDQPDSRFDNPAHAASPLAETFAAVLADEIGKTIGPYKLLQVIGEGGMGVVYLAEQREPVERKVALKIIKPGMDSRQVIARFEAERQALALMDHPNIARVLDAGTVGQVTSASGWWLEGEQKASPALATSTSHSAGRPYFVMELVKGVPITTYCDEKHLSVQERLELMIPVCLAIQHAHQKGIIHRDIKPTNVLIAQYDGRPAPKVIDFGIAKALTPARSASEKLDQSVERASVTEIGQFVGTLEYMSPEQADLNPVDVDTRTDIYSLGVLLYETLTGTTPFGNNLKSASFEEARRIIREEEPETVSRRLARTKASKPQEIQHSAFRIQNLRELDWIVAKALDKDRARRYESAAALAADIERYLAGEPVQAFPPSAAYRFRKFADRNRAALATTVIVALALLSATVFSVWESLVANSSRQLADERLASEQRARDEAETHRRRAEVESERAETHFQKALEAVDRMLTRVGDDSLRNIPHMEDVQKQLLEDAIEFYESLLRERPGDFRVRKEAAHSYLRVLNAYDCFQQGDELQAAMARAHELFRELLQEKPDDFDILLGLARTHTWLGWKSKEGSQEQENHFRRARDLILARQTQGVPESRAEDFRSVLGRAHENLASSLANQGRFDESEALFHQALSQGEGHHQFAWQLAKAGRLPEAITYMEQAVRERQKQIGDSSKWKTNAQLEYAESCRALGHLFAEANRAEEAVAQLQTAEALYRSVVRDYPSVTGYQLNWTHTRFELAHGYLKLGSRSVESNQTEEAIRQLKKGADVVEQVAVDVESRASHFSGEPAYQELLTKSRRVLAGTYYDLGKELFASGRMDEAVAFSQKSVAAYGRLARDNPSETAYTSGLIHARVRHFNAKVRSGLAVSSEESKQAVEDITVQLERDPSDSFYYKWRGTAHFQLGHFDLALADIAKAVELFAGDNSNLIWIDPSLVAACPDARFREGLFALADKAVALAGHQGNLASRGELYAAHKDWQRAQADFERALAIDPNHARAQTGLALMKTELAKQQDSRLPPAP